MYMARGALSGRMVDDPPKPRRKRHHPPSSKKYMCYVPFMWSTCAAVLVGFVIIGGGVAMCTAGYYAEEFSVLYQSNGTHNWTAHDPSNVFHMRNLTYAGPIFMGVGCFVIVVACVVVFETRDRRVKIMIEEDKKKVQHKPDFYDLIIEKMKQEQERLSARFLGEDNLGFDDEPDDNQQTSSPGFFRSKQSSGRSRKSTKRRYSSRSAGSVTKALKGIPLTIFAIDVDNRRKTSMTPVRMPEVENSDTASAQLTVPESFARHHSASCIHDMFKARTGTQNSLGSTLRPPIWLHEAQLPSPVPGPSRPLTDRASLWYEQDGVLQDDQSSHNTNNSNLMVRGSSQELMVPGSRGSTPLEPLCARETISSPVDRRQPYIVTVSLPSQISNHDEVGDEIERCPTGLSGNSDRPVSSTTGLSRNSSRTTMVVVHQAKALDRAPSLDPSSRTASMDVSLDITRSPSPELDDPVDDSTGAPKDHKGALQKLDSRATLSAVSPSFHGVQIVSGSVSDGDADADNDSLELTDDIMKNFDMNADTFSAGSGSSAA